MTVSGIGHLFRNIEHVEITLDKAFWIDQGMAPARAAVTA